VSVSTASAGRDTTRAPDRPIRVLQVVGSLNRAGAETWLVNVLRNIDRDRFHVDFLVHSPIPGAYDAVVRAMGSQVLVCPPPARLPAYVRQFTRILRRNGPYDIVHSHLWFFSAVPLWLAALSGVSVRIAHIYPLTDIKPQTVARKLYRRVALAAIRRYATLYVSDSHASWSAFERTGSARGRPHRVLYCGIELDRFSTPGDRGSTRAQLGLPLDRPVVTYVARFVPSKNQELVFRVADEINRSQAECHFVLAGSHGELLQTFVNKARGRSDVTVLVGLPDVSALLLASDLFLFPSLEEGFGLVGLEAAAAGLPVVATDLPTIREAIPPGFREWMFPANDVERASTNVRALLRNGELRITLAAEGRRWSATFSIERSATELASLYEQTLDLPATIS
jgi:glycosyltransferase involved in cell wall biosynthesis